VNPERVEQAHVARLLRTIGATVYVLGVTRKRGDHPGTMQSRGLPDLLAFLPRGNLRAVQLLVVEVKAERGRLSPEQEDFRDHCRAADVAHVVGGLDAVIAWLVANGYLRRDQVPHYRHSEAVT
jgi:hypothetical protein